MKVTLFSIIMAVFFSTLFIVVIHFLRNRSFFIRTFGAHTVLLLYGACVFRMMFAVEAPFTQVVNAETIYNGFYKMGDSVHLNVFDRSINLFEVAFIVWILVAICLSAAFLAKTAVTSRKLSGATAGRSEQVERILKNVQGESSRALKVEARIYRGITIPVGIGLFRKRICLPEREYSDDDLYYILKHEYTHFCNRDLHIKFLVRLFSCVFWWNPAVYMLKRDVGRILEIKCDMVATEHFKKEEKLESPIFRICIYRCPACQVAKRYLRPLEMVPF